MLTPCYIPDALQNGAVRTPLAGWFARTYGATSGYFGLKSPAVGPGVDWTMPGADGSNGQFLQTNGSGTLSWGTVSVSGYLVQTPATNGANTVQPGGVSVVPFTIKNIAGQTADAQQWQDSSGNVLSKIDKSGNHVAPKFATGLTSSDICWQAVSGSKFGVLAGDASAYATVQCASVNCVNSVVITTQAGPVLQITGSGFFFNDSGLTTLQPISCGAITIKDGSHVILGTSTGTKIGTLGGASGQKLAFFNSTPIVQPLLATGAAHTVDDVITTLQNLGLCRQT